MKPIPSSLKIVDFAIVGFEFNLVPDPDDKDVCDFFDSYELDIDFNMFKTDILQVRIRTEINTGDNLLPGYSITATAACIFEFAKDANLTEEERNNIEGFSTIYIALNTLRGLISNFTANAPFGRYILPSIDLNDLIRKKMEMQTQTQTDKKKDTGTKKITDNNKKDIDKTKKVKEKKKPL